MEIGYPAQSNAYVSAGSRGRPVAHGRQIIGPGRVHRFLGARRPNVRDLAGRVAERVKQLKLCTVVFGDRREVLVKRLLHQLEREDDFLRPVDQDQNVAEPGGILQALEDLSK